MPGVARSSHWADAGIAQTTRVTTARNSLIKPSDSMRCYRRRSTRDANTLDRYESFRLLNRPQHTVGDSAFRQLERAVRVRPPQSPSSLVHAYGIRVAPMVLDLAV
jgi:hypothetical protein